MATATLEASPATACPCGHSGRLASVRGMSFDDLQLWRCPRCGLISIVGDDSRTEPQAVPFRDLSSDAIVRDRFHAQSVFSWVQSVSHPEHRPRLLDIGCRYGAVVEIATAAGWDAYGADLDAPLIAEARNRGINAHCADGVQFAVTNRPFDVLVLSHVLEHLPDPTQALRTLRSSLSPHGTLYIEVPVADSPIAWAVYRRRWLGIAAPGHRWAFTRNTLRSLLRRSGLEIVRSESWLGYSYPATFKGTVRKVLFRFFDLIDAQDCFAVLAQPTEEGSHVRR